MAKRALILGASGLVGGELLQLLLKDKAYEKVLVFARNPLEVTHPKLEQELGDLTSTDFYRDKEGADEMFICIGTTRSKTPDLNQYKKIDLGIPVQATQWALQRGMEKVLVISALGANANSKIFYNRIKGNMEKELKKLNPQRLYILRPSLILGSRKEFRFGEKVGKIVAQALNVFIPKKYKGIAAKDIAQAMHKLAARQEKGHFTIESHEIAAIAAEA